MNELVGFKELTIADLEPYKNIFFELFGKNTRYNIFENDKVNEFYYTWMINSITGQMDDKCIGYYEKDALAGFLTFRIRENVLTIGLLGVLPKFQGQGVAQILLSYATSVAIRNNVIFMNISTQGQNLHAINAYIKNDFKISSIKQWYYLET